MPTDRLSRRHALAIVALTLSLGAAACGSDSGTEDATNESTGTETTTETSIDTTEETGEEPAADPETDAEASDMEAASGFPLTIQNCGVEVTFDAPPERVVLISPYAASMLDAVDSVDTIVARVGAFTDQYFDDDLFAKLEPIPELVSDTDQTGGVEISLESILELEPDLVVGYETETIARDRLAGLGVNLYVAPPFCDTPPPVSFASITDEVRLFGDIFGQPEAAADAAAELETRISGVESAAVEDGTTAAALYVSSQGPPLYAYSALGMVHPQMEAMGMVNVFAELPERVPEVSLEALIDANPQVLILLYGEPEVDEQVIIDAVVNAPGAEAIDAVANGRVYPMLFNFAEPPSPIVVDGLDVMRSLLEG